MQVCPLLLKSLEGLRRVLELITRKRLGNTGILRKERYRLFYPVHPRRDFRVTRRKTCTCASQRLVHGFGMVIPVSGRDLRLLEVESRGSLITVFPSFFSELMEAANTGGCSFRTNAALHPVNNGVELIPLVRFMFVIFIVSFVFVSEAMSGFTLIITGFA